MQVPFLILPRNKVRNLEICLIRESLIQKAYRDFFLDEKIMHAYWNDDLDSFENLREKWMRDEEYSIVLGVLDFMVFKK